MVLSTFVDTRLLLVHFSGHLRVFDCLTLSTLVDTADYRQAAGGKICALHIFFYASGAEALAY